MKIKNILAVAFVSTTIMATSCRSHYEMTGLERTRILIDNRYDSGINEEDNNFMRPYKQKVDSMMSPVVGQLAHYMYADWPESPLSDLLSDVLVWAGKKYNEQPDFGVYNIGGIRAALAEGDVTVGDVLELAPFENKICFVTMTGKDVMELFDQMAMQLGQGVSHEVKLTISKKGKLIEALVSGKPVDLDRAYRIVTLDYVAQGNDKMAAFKMKTDVNSPQDEQNNIRYIIMDYFREKMAQGKKVSQQIEGRINIVE